MQNIVTIHSFTFLFRGMGVLPMIPRAGSPYHDSQTIPVNGYRISYSGV
jgi:hypothetical protein